MGGFHVRTESKIKSGNAEFWKTFTYHFWVRNSSSHAKSDSISFRIFSLWSFIPIQMRIWSWISDPCKNISKVGSHTNFWNAMELPWQRFYKYKPWHLQCTTDSVFAGHVQALLHQYTVLEPRFSNQETLLSKSTKFWNQINDSFMRSPRYCPAYPNMLKISRTGYIWFSRLGN